MEPLSFVQDATGGGLSGTAALPEAAPAAAGARPRPVVPVADGLIGLAALTLAWGLVVWLKPDQWLATWLVLLATATPMLAREAARAPALAAGRWTAFGVLPWLVGLVVATAPFIVVHGQAGSLVGWAGAWVVIAPAFALRLVVEAVRNRRAPAAGFPLALGRALLSADREALKRLAPAARLWALKAFFIPLYALSLYALVGMALGNGRDSPLAWLALAVTFAYTIDLSFGLSGYVFASNDLIPTLRSTQTRLLGWIVCLLCYAPAFHHWPDFAEVVTSEVDWPHLVGANPTLLVAEALMLALLVLYVSATVVFGLRFCNLSNRGLISSGPYRLMKHPAYFAHVGNAWIITFIFLPAAGVTLSLSQMLVPVAFTLLYRLRAVTEEAHLREDPDYVAYADWIARNGVLGRLRRLPGVSR